MANEQTIDKEDLISFLLPLDDGFAVPESSSSAKQDEDLRLPNGKELPKKVLLVRFGDNPYTKDGVASSFTVSPEAADEIISEFDKRGRDLVIDYEHQSLSGGEAPAAGWLSKLTKAADGIYGIVKEWTPKAKKYLSSGEYKHLSPVLQFAKNKNHDGTSMPSAIHSVALSNHAALWNPPNVQEMSDLTLVDSFSKCLSAAEGIASAFSDVASELDGVMTKAAKLAADKPELMEKLIAFKAKLESGNGMQAFADAATPAVSSVTQSAAPAASEVPAQSATVDQAAPSAPENTSFSKVDANIKSMTPSQFKDWAMGEVSTSSDPKYIEHLKGALNDNALKIAQEKANTPSETNKGVAPMATPEQVAPQAPAAAPVVAPAQAAYSDMGFKSIAGLIGFSDIEDQSKVIQRVGQMKNVCLSVNKSFAKYGVQSFSDLDAKIDSIVAKEKAETAKAWPEHKPQCKLWRSGGA